MHNDLLRTYNISIMSQKGQPPVVADAGSVGSGSSYKQPISNSFIVPDYSSSSKRPITLRPGATPATSASVDFAATSDGNPVVAAANSQKAELKKANTATTKDLAVDPFQEDNNMQMLHPLSQQATDMMSDEEFKALQKQQLKLEKKIAKEKKKREKALQEGADLPADPDQESVVTMEDSMLSFFESIGSGGVNGGNSSVMSPGGDEGGVVYFNDNQQQQQPGTGGDSGDNDDGSIKSAPKFHDDHSEFGLERAYTIRELLASKNDASSVEERSMKRTIDSTEGRLSEKRSRGGVSDNEVDNDGYMILPLRNVQSSMMKSKGDIALEPYSEDGAILRHTNAQQESADYIIGMDDNTDIPSVVDRDNYQQDLDRDVQDLLSFLYEMEKSVIDAEELQLKDDNSVFEEFNMVQGLGTLETDIGSNGLKKSESLEKLSTMWDGIEEANNAIIPIVMPTVSAITVEDVVNASSKSSKSPSKQGSLSTSPKVITPPRANDTKMQSSSPMSLSVEITSPNTSNKASNITSPLAATSQPQTTSPGGQMSAVGSPVKPAIVASTPSSASINAAILAANEVMKSPDRTAATTANSKPGNNEPFHSTSFAETTSSSSAATTGTKASIKREPSGKSLNGKSPVVRLRSLVLGAKSVTEDSSEPDNFEAARKRAQEDAEKLQKLRDEQLKQKIEQERILKIKLEEQLAKEMEEQAKHGKAKSLGFNSIKAGLTKRDYSELLQKSPVKQPIWKVESSSRPATANPNNIVDPSDAALGLALSASLTMLSTASSTLQPPTSSGSHKKRMSILRPTTPSFAASLSSSGESKQNLFSAGSIRRLGNESPPSAGTTATKAALHPINTNIANSRSSNPSNYSNALQQFLNGQFDPLMTNSSLLMSSTEQDVIIPINVEQLFEELQSDDLIEKRFGWSRGNYRKKPIGNSNPANPSLGASGKSSPNKTSMRGSLSQMGSSMRQMSIRGVGASTKAAKASTRNSFILPSAMDYIPGFDDDIPALGANSNSGAAATTGEDASPHKSQGMKQSNSGTALDEHGKPVAQPNGGSPSSIFYNYSGLIYRDPSSPLTWKEINMNNAGPLDPETNHPSNSIAPGTADVSGFASSGGKRNLSAGKMINAYRPWGPVREKDPLEMLLKKQLELAQQQASSANSLAGSDDEGDHHNHIVSFEDDMRRPISSPSSSHQEGGKSVFLDNTPVKKKGMKVKHHPSPSPTRQRGGNHEEDIHDAQVASDSVFTEHHPDPRYTNNPPTASGNARRMPIIINIINSSTYQDFPRASSPTAALFSSTM